MRTRDVEQSQLERARLRFIPLGLLVAPWVAWAIFDWKIGVYAAVAVLLFWAVGHYLNYFHLKDAKQKLADAQDALERATTTS